jgi:preprotein translocase subunit SecA
MASITFQNYFRMYKKLSGMTGTADTEAYEFQDIYGLETVVIPTHRTMVRVDAQDKVYCTEAEKYEAIIEDIKSCSERRQPVLVGTTSIENSELLSQALTKAGIAHNVLNAKQHEREAQIVLEAGRPGMVTIATNMAGRGTDIVLGGGINKHIEDIRSDATLSDEEKKAKIDEVKAQWQVEHDAVVAAGGLRIIGSERHESRRIDNQLRGRSGRQGDPGSSVFYLSMEDQLLRIFGGDKMRAIAERLKLERGEAIESKMLTRMIESAQRKVEGRNYDIRKQLLEFDDVQNDQRREIYRLRNGILESSDVGAEIKDLRHGFFTDLFRAYVPAETVEEQWDLDGLMTVLKGDWGIDLPLKQMLEVSNDVTDEDLLAKIIEAADAIEDQKEALVGHEAWVGFARQVLLQVLDTTWRQHITALDALRQGIYLRSYGQKQPKQEYKREAFEMFGTLLGDVRESVCRVLMHVQITMPEEVQATAPAAEEPAQSEEKELDFSHVGRNDPCPCGSGKRYKDCHGRLK